MQFIIKIHEADTFKHYSLDNVLSLMLGLNMDIKNISTAKDGIDYVIVDTEISKIGRLKKLCDSYMSDYNRNYVLEDLKNELSNNKISKNKFQWRHYIDQKVKEMTSTIFISVISKSDIKIPLDEKRDDTLSDILK